MTAMRDDDDDIVELVDDEMPIFDDPVSQRAYAFVHLGKFAETCADETARDLTYTMMRKVCQSIKATSTADIKLLDGGKS
jgi:hypothetical protein